MTFNAQETSIQDGSPVELYEFVRGPTTFRYTSNDTDYVFETKTYEATTLVRSGLEDTGELPKSNLKIEARRDFPVSELFRLPPPSDVVTLKILRVHRTDAGQEGATIWLGRGINAEWKGARSELTCESLFTALRRPGLRRPYQRSCPHLLYSAPCGVSDIAYKETVAVTGVLGPVVSADEFALQADGYYAGGYVRWERAPGLYERRAIRGQTGGSITMLYPLEGLEIGASIDVYPGCDHSLATCNSKFSNLANFGGFPFIPIKNPFGGSPIF